MSTSMEIGRVETPYGAATIVAGRYPAGGAIAIQLVTADGMAEPIATFSTNLVSYGAQVESDEFCVKTWSENEPLVAPMLASGLFADTGKRAAASFAMSPIWRVADAAHVPPPSRP